MLSSPDRQNKFSASAFEIQHFKYAAPYDSLYFNHNQVSSPNILTLLIRTDACFATRQLLSNCTKQKFSQTAQECTSREANNFRDEIERAYESWGQRIVMNLAQCLDYEKEYGLASGFSHVHFHKGSALITSTIRKSGCLFNPDKETPLFISLDDMINKKAFVEAGIEGAFAEVCFSRKYSEDGIKSGFINRPGHPSLEIQLAQIKAILKSMQSKKGSKVPIILLEDNVRKGETLLWIFDEMKKNGVFENGDLRGIATCFSVASTQEQSRVQYDSRQIPVVVGANYLAFDNSNKIDVITPRDHFFDGLVVQSRDGDIGRYPSIMFDSKLIAKNFKIAAAKSECFRDEVLRSNIDFCDRIQDNTNVILTLSDFTPGYSMSRALDIHPTEPMTKALTKLQTTHVGPS